MKQLGWDMVLLPATIITRRLLTNIWNSWCIVMIFVIATKARAQDLESIIEPDELPAQVLKGMDMSHETYCLDAFDCDEPEDVFRFTILQVHECSTADNTKVFFNPISWIQHSLNANLEVNYIHSTVEESLSYDGSYSYCLGMDSQVDGNRMESLLTTKSLEFTLRTITIQEEYNTDDIIVKENGVSIPAAYKQDLGMITDFGSLVFQRNQPPCQ